MGISMDEGPDLPDYHWISTDRTAGSEWHNAELMAQFRNSARTLLDVIQLQNEALKRAIDTVHSEFCGADGHQEDLATVAKMMGEE